MKLPTDWQRQIAQLPLSRELPQIDGDATIPTQSVNGEPWGKAEITVRSVLSRLANIPEERIGRHTSIYRYGLDSIGAVQLATLLRRESCAISAVDVIENPTCAGIASRITTQDSEDGEFIYNFGGFQDAVSHSINTSLGPDKTYEALLPCTPTLQGMISQFLNSEGTLYFNYASWTLEAGVNPQQVARAWSDLASHCQMLRTGFVSVNHQDTSYAMVVYPKAEFSAPVSTCEADAFNDSDWRTAAAQRALRELSMPPWQVVIVDHGLDPPTMHLAIHHALYDANSLRKMLGLLNKTLSGAIDREPFPIQPALSSWLNPAHSQSTSEAFWREKAGDLVVTNFQ